MLFVCLLVVTIQDAQSEDDAGMQSKTKKAKVGCSPKESRKSVMCIIWKFV